ncbi:8227_t:CDS:1, partial [Gigaspora margarita]
EAFLTMLISSMLPPTCINEDEAKAKTEVSSKSPTQSEGGDRSKTMRSR